MNNIIDRQTLIFSVNLDTFNPAGVLAQVEIPISLRFPADELIVKSITYNPKEGAADLSDSVQIACNITNDNLIAAFPNKNPFTQQHEDHFKISGTFQNGIFMLQFQGTDGSLDNVPNFKSPLGSCLPQRLISSQNPQRTKGTVILTIEFIRHDK